MTSSTEAQIAEWLAALTEKAPLRLSEQQELALVQHLVSGEDRKKYTELVQALGRGEGFGTHSNRMADSRNVTWLTASISPRLRDGEYMFPSDVLDSALGGAAMLPKLGIVLAPFLLNGRKTTLADGILENRTSAQWLLAQGILLKPVTRKVPRPSALDKQILVPVGQDATGAHRYTAVFPVTPAGQYPAALEAVSALMPLVMADRDDPKDSGLIIHGAGRLDKLANFQNYSYRISRMGGRIFRPLMPVFSPTKPAGFNRRGLMVLRSNIYQMIGAASRQLLQLQHISTASGGTRMSAEYAELAYNLGVQVGSLLRECFNDLPSDIAPAELTKHEATRSLLLAYRAGSIAGMGVQLVQLFSPEKLRKLGLSFGLGSFEAGLEAGLDFGRKAQTAPVASTPSRKPRGAKPSPVTPVCPQGETLCFRIVADDVDLGTNSACVGLPALTALHGMLHAVIERAAPTVRIKSFKPVFHRVSLGMHDNRLVHRYVPEVPASGRRKAEPARYTVFTSDPQATSLKGPLTLAANSKVGFGTPDLDAVVLPPLVSVIRGQVDMSLVVVLDQAVSREQLNAFAQKLRFATLAGGMIHTVRRAEFTEDTSFGWTLQKTEDTVGTEYLASCYLNSAFAGRDYLGGGVVQGLAPVGYWFLHDDAIPTHRAPGFWGQTIYRGVTLVPNSAQRTDCFWKVAPMSDAPTCWRLV